MDAENEFHKKMVIDIGISNKNNKLKALHETRSYLVYYDNLFAYETNKSCSTYLTLSNE